MSTTVPSRVLPAAVFVGLLLTALWLLPTPETAVAEDGARGPHVATGYVGAAACVRCHEQAHAHWLTSSHAQTFEPVTRDNLPGSVVAQDTVQHAPGSTRFEAGEDGTWRAHTVGADGKQAPFDLTHVVGRMRVQMFVATMQDGRQQVLPGMLEVPKDEWFDYTKLIFGGPGSDWDTPPVVPPGHPSFWTGTVRAWGPRCARCHVSGWTPHTPRATGPRYSSRQLGVDCESCHGPAQDHVAWHDAKAAGTPTATPTDPILALQKLSHERAVSVCLQCHMEADLVDRRFVPGDDVFEHVDPTLIVSPERIDPYGRVLELIYDGLPFSASRCATEGKLTCFTCHEPHGSEHPSQLRASPDGPALCADCHQEQVAAGRAHTGHDPAASGASCIGCHMPFLRIERGHGVVADHAISVPRLGLPGDRVARSACETCHDGGDLAPTDAPKLDRKALEAGYAKTWPKPAPLPFWQRAFAAARTKAKDGHVGLLQVLHDAEQPRVVRASAAALLEPHAAQVPLALLARAKDEDPLVRATTLRTLATLEGASVDNLLLAAMADPSRLVRIAAARESLRGWKRARANPALVAAAIPVLEADVTEIPDDWVRWFTLAGAYDIAGQVERALAAYRNVALLDPFALHVRRRIGELEKLVDK